MNLKTKTTTRWRSDKYLEFVRSRPCCVTGSEVDVVAHHVRCFGHGGVGLKPPDWMCVPLTAVEHAKLHHVGEKSYWLAAGQDVVAALNMTMLVYLASQSGYELLECLAEVVVSR